MKFKNINIKNKYLKLENINITFDKTGVYLIRGLNGSGKTTLMEQLIFGENELEDSTEEQQRAYETERYNLISYVPQNLEVYSCTVYEYLTKENKQIDINQLHSYFELFEIDYIDFKENLNKLSGGEVTKLAIIGAVLKNTPYIIMDEPTNNLDNGSVKKLCELIEKIKNDTTVILITHDTRLQFQSSIQYELEKGKICRMTDADLEQDTNTKINNRQPADNECVSMNKVVRKLQCGLQNYLNYMMILIGFILLITINFNEFENKYSVNKVPDKNLIAIFSSGDLELNRIYMKGAHLKQEETTNLKNVTYADVPRIAQKEDIKEIYMMDEEYINEVIEREEKYKPKKENIIQVSIPDNIYNNYIENIGLVNFLSLEKGNAPKEGEKQIALSYRILEKKLGIKKEKVQLGMQIAVDGEKYQLSGIMANDIGWTSYKKDDKASLYYRYQKESYENFMKRNTLEEGEICEENEPGNMMIVTEDGMEQKVLNQLFEEYGGNNYSSSVYMKVWTKQYNRESLKTTFLLNIVIAMIYGVVLSIVVRATMKDELRKIKDYENYYIYNNKIRKNYIVYKGIIALCCMMLAMIINAVVNHNYLYCSFVFLITDVIIILVGILIQTYMQVRK